MRRSEDSIQERVETNQDPRSGKRRWGRRLLLIGGGAILIWVLGAGILVGTFGSSFHFDHPTEAIVVLGAGVEVDRPSPVFEARLRHAVELHQAGSAPLLVFTGGTGAGDRLSEAEVGRNYALAAGVSSRAIRMETRSRTTYQNLEEAKRILDAEGIPRSVRIVSDPDHLLRATWMAHRLGFGVFHDATPYSRYQSWPTRLPFVLREIYFLHHFAVFGE